jgi:predicted hydrocarbon binding protein
LELPTADDDHSQRLKRVLENSLQEILGVQKTEGVLSSLQVCDQTCISLLFQVLINEYGQKTAEGIMLRIGQSAYKYALTELGAILGLDDTSFRLLSTQEKMIEGIDLIEGFYSELAEVDTKLEYTGTSILIHLPQCPVCRGMDSINASCTFIIGLLQEFTSWVGAGKTYLVRETSCSAAGNLDCTFEINLTPLEA